MELKAIQKINGYIKYIGKKIDNYKEVREKHGIKGVIYCLCASFLNKTGMALLRIGECLLHFAKRPLDWGDVLIEKSCKEAYKKAMKKQCLKL